MILTPIVNHIFRALKIIKGSMNTIGVFNSDNIVLSKKSDY